MSRPDEESQPPAPVRHAFASVREASKMNPVRFAEVIGAGVAFVRCVERGSATTQEAQATVQAVLKSNRVTLAPEHRATLETWITEAGNA